MNIRNFKCGLEEIKEILSRYTVSDFYFQFKDDYLLAISTAICKTLPINESYIGEGDWEDSRLDFDSNTVIPDSCGLRFECHVGLHPIYEVPWIYMNVFNRSGEIQPLETLQVLLSKIALCSDEASSDLKYNLIQEEHPVINWPFYSLHLCGIREILQLSLTQAAAAYSLENSENENILNVSPTLTLCFFLHYVQTHLKLPIFPPVSPEEFRNICNNIINNRKL